MTSVLISLFIGVLIGWLLCEARSTGLIARCIANARTAIDENQSLIETIRGLQAELITLQKIVHRYERQEEVRGDSDWWKN